MIRRGFNHRPDCHCRLCKVPTGAEHWNWRGQDAAYNSVHAWVERELGKPMVCAECATRDAKKYEWANLSGLYLRDTSDWKRLCTSCHVQMDGRFGEGNGQAKFSRGQIIEVRKLRASGVSVEEILQKIGISKTHYYRVINKQTRCFDAANS